LDILSSVEPWDRTIAIEIEGLFEGTMDLEKAIEQLYAEKERLERVIAALEELQLSGASMSQEPRPRSRRGRKSMGAAERLEVSERMKRYWAGRRTEPAAQAVGGQGGSVHHG
jgi:hypothetical protein